jgi:hypothetical protein
MHISMNFALVKGQNAPNSYDSIKLDIKLGDSASKIAGVMFQAGIDKDPANSDWDVWRLNLKNKLATGAKIEILGTTIPKLNDCFKTLLQDYIKSIPILPIPTKPGNPSPAIINYSALKVVGDPAIPNTNALALLLVFGGGNQGTLSPSYTNPLFINSFILPGESGRIAINFAWICRLIAPALEHIVGPLTFFNNADYPQNILGQIFYSGCAMDTQYPIILLDNQGCKFQLSNFWLVQIDSQIKLIFELTIDLPTMQTTKYMQISTLTLALDDSGEVQVTLSADTNNPSVQQDLGWRIGLDILTLGGNEAATALANALVGVAVNSVVREINYAINWAINDKLKNAIKQLTQYVEKKTEAINNIPFDVDIQLKDLTVSNGDILVGCSLKAKEAMPIKVEGSFLSPTEGDCINLDDGTLVGNSSENADLELSGGELTALSRTKIAQATGLTFEESYHYQLYPLTFDQTSIPINTGGVYVVKTRQGRLSIVQVTSVPDSDHLVQFKTFDAQSLLHQWDALVAFLAMLI